MKSGTEQWLLTVVWGCLAAALCVPLISSAALLNSSNLFKMTVFEIATAAAFSAWLVLACLCPRYRPSWRHPVVIAVAVFIAAVFFTLPFALDPAHSFWSDYWRLTGAVNLVHFVAWFVVLASVLRTWRAWTAFWCAGGAVAVACSLVAVGQWLSGETLRSMATLGNPAYFAAYILPFFFLAILFASRSRHRSVRAAFFSAAALFAFALALSATRAAALALAVGVLVGLLLSLRNIRSASKRRLAAVGLFGVLALSGAAFCLLRFGPLAAWGQANLPYQISRVVYSDLGEDRQHLWAIALDGIKERPLFGWGMEGYSAVFDRHVDPQGQDLGVVFDLWNDRAHNEYLDLWVASGIVGLTAYLLVLGAALIVLVRKWLAAPEAEDRQSAAWLIAALSAVAVHNAFLFDTTSASIVFYGLLAFAVFLTARPREGKKSVARWCLAPVLVCVFLIGAGETVATVRPFLAAAKLSHVRAQFTSNPQEALATFSDALSPGTYLENDIRWNLLETQAIGENYIQTRRDELRDIILFSASELDASAAERPYDYRTLLGAAHANRLAATYEPERLAAAEQYLDAAFAITRNRSEAFEELALVKVASGDLVSAGAALDEALARSFSASQGRLQYLFACVLAAQGRFDEAFAALAEAEQSGFKSEQDIRFIIILAEGLEEQTLLPQATAYADRMLAAFGEHEQALASAAVLYAREGQATTAGLLMDLLEKKDPAWAEATRKTYGALLPAE